VVGLCGWFRAARKLGRPDTIAYDITSHLPSSGQGLSPELSPISDREVSPNALSGEPQKDQLSASEGGITEAGQASARQCAYFASYCTLAIKAWPPASPFSYAFLGSAPDYQHVFGFWL
jgi:hypothetical protein